MIRRRTTKPCFPYLVHAAAAFFPSRSVGLVRVFSFFNTHNGLYRTMWTPLPCITLSAQTSRSPGSTIGATLGPKNRSRRPVWKSGAPHLRCSSSLLSSLFLDLPLLLLAMKFFSTVLLAPALFSELVCAAPSPSVTEPRSSVSLLSRRDTSDPFYTPPTGYESTAQGTVLRNRTFTPNSLLGAGVTGYQLLYRTTSLNNTPSYTVTTVLVPPKPIANLLFSYQNAEDSVAANCAPSYTVAANDTTTPNYNTGDLGVLAELLSLNWTTAFPDYEGPTGAYGAGRVEAHGVLDGLTAAISFAPLNLSSMTKVMGLGYSGGAIATSWAAALQPTYAPSLNVLGFAHGGTPCNFTSDMIQISSGASSALLVSVMAGLTSVYPALNTFFESIQTPAGATYLEVARNSCLTQVFETYAGTTILNATYQSFGANLIYQPEVVAVFNDNLLGPNASEMATAPIFVYQALEDELIPVGSVDAMVSQFCAHNIKSLQYTRITGNTTHSGAAVAWVPRVLQWFEGRVAGVAPVTGCSITNISVADAPVSSSSISTTPTSSSSGSASSPTGTKTGTASKVGASSGGLLALLAAGFMALA